MQEKRFVGEAKMIRKIGLLTFVVLLLGAAGIGAETKTALVIGNGDYASSPLKNPPNDARDMSSALQELGFSVTTLVDAGGLMMERAIRQFGQDLARDRDGVGLFFYAGHGMQVNGRNYLVPVDADIQSEDEIRWNSVDAGQVLSKMERAANRTNIVMLDACRDNPFKRSFRTGSRGLARMDTPTGSLVVYATAPGDVAADGDGRNGVFTGSLLEHIYKSKEIEALLKEVRRDVMAETGGKQTPWSSSSLAGNFYFTSASSGGEEPSSEESGVVDRDGPPSDETDAVAGGTGELFVDTVPSGARITIDGEEKGTTPVLVSGVSLYTDITVAARKGNRSGSKEVRLDGPGLHEISIVLDTEKGNLFVKSVTRDVDVYLDGKKQGPLRNGLFKDVSTGSYTVELKGEGLYWKGEATIETDKTAMVTAEVQEVGTIAYEVPSGAAAVVEGPGFRENISGRGALENVPVGSYRAVADGAEYSREEASFTVRKGRETEYGPYTSGELRLESDPSGASVYIDGNYTGTTPLSVAVERGSREIKLTKSGYEDYTGSVYVTGGKKTSKSFTLEEERYDIGERGPAGGLVFYDKGRSTDGWRYLEAAPKSTEWNNKVWDARGQKMGGTSTRIGSGKMNTEKIVNYLNRHGGSGKAAQLCDDLSYGGYTDWFLPSKDELDLMYKNLHRKGLGGFADGTYWSSSEGINHSAWYQYFGSGRQGTHLKNLDLRVRAVRAF